MISRFDADPAACRVRDKATMDESMRDDMSLAPNPPESPLTGGGGSSNPKKRAEASKDSDSGGVEFEPPAHCVRKILKDCLPEHSVVCKSAGGAVLCLGFEVACAALPSLPPLFVVSLSLFRLH